MSLSGPELEAQAEDIDPPASLPLEEIHDSDAPNDAASEDENPAEEGERDALLDHVPRMLGMFPNQTFLR